jgi:hypothetical protein
MFFATRFPPVSPMWLELQLNKSNRPDNMGKSGGKTRPWMGIVRPAVNKKESGGGRSGRSRRVIRPVGSVLSE